MPVSLSFHTESAPAVATGVGVYADRIDESGLDAATLRQLNFEAKPEQIAVLPGPGGTTLAIGLGEAAKVSSDGFRRAAAAFVKAARSYPKAELRLIEAAAPDLATAAAQAVAECWAATSSFVTRASPRRQR